MLTNEVLEYKKFRIFQFFIISSCLQIFKSKSLSLLSPTPPRGVFNHFLSANFTNASYPIHSIPKAETLEYLYSIIRLNLIAHFVIEKIDPFYQSLFSPRKREDLPFQFNSMPIIFLRPKPQNCVFCLIWKRNNVMLRSLFI